MLNISTSSIIPIWKAVSEVTAMERERYYNIYLSKGIEALVAELSSVEHLPVKHRQGGPDIYNKQFINSRNKLKKDLSKGGSPRQNPKRSPRRLAKSQKKV
jgi:hypothetical protein